MNPKLSIILPYKNCGLYFKDCIQSLLDSSFLDFELLLINDHSEDDSHSIAQSYTSKDSRIILLNSPQKGIVPALNLGLKKAKGEFIARMDGDDTIHPHRFQIQVDHLSKNPNITLTSSLITPLFEYPPTEGLKRYLAWVNQVQTNDIEQHLFIESPLPHPSVMFRKKEILRLNGYREYDGPEDYDLWLRLVEAGHNLSKINQPLLNWRFHGENHSKKQSKYSTLAFEKRKWEHILWFLTQRLPSRKKIWIWGAGKKGGKLGLFLLNSGLTIEGFLDIDPNKIGRQRHHHPIMDAHTILDKKEESFFYLCWVGSWNAREQIEHYLTQKRMQRGKDYLLL